MIWDREFDGVGPKPEILSERAYHALYWTTLALLTFAEVFVGTSLSIRLQLPALGGFPAGMGIANFLLARYFVGIYLRRRGLTRANGQATTLSTRTPLIPAGEPEAEVVEVAPPAWLWCACAAICGGSTLVGAGLLWIARHDGTGGQFTLWEWFGIVATIGMGLLTLFYGLVTPSLNTRTTVDATGIWGFPRDLAIRRRFIPWSAIAACEVETYHNPNGKPLSVRPILLDAAGNRLIRLDTGGIARADRDRLIRAIQARLPRKV